MFEWLMQLPVWVQIVFALIILGCFIYVFINLLRAGFSFTKNNTSISFGSEKKYLPKHANCPHAKDIIIVLNETQQVLHQKYIVEYKEQMQTQMNYAEQKADQIRMLFQKIAVDELEKLDEADPKILQLNIFLVRLMFREIENNVLALFRTSFRINHFDEMSEKEFGIFCGEKADFIIAQINEMFSNLHTYHNMIAASRLIETVFNPIRNKLAESVVDVYQNARSVALDNKVKLLAFDEKIDRIMKKYITGE